MLVAELGCRSRFEGRGIDGFYRGNIAIEQEYMPVELPCAALRAGRAVKANLPYDSSEAFHWIFKETVAFLRQCRDA